MCKGKDRKVDSLLTCPVENEGCYVDSEWFDDSLMYKDNANQNQYTGMLSKVLPVIEVTDDYEQQMIDEFIEQNRDAIANYGSGVGIDSEFLEVMEKFKGDGND